MRNLFTPLLLALLTALLATACQKDEPAPPCRQDTALPRPHYPGNPYPLPYLPDDPTVVPTAYSVDAYLEPNLVFGSWTDYARGEADLFFFNALPPTTASAAAADRPGAPRQLFAPQRDTSPADSLAYIRQARLRGETGTVHRRPDRFYTLLMNVTSLRAELLEADGTPTDISDRCTLTYTDFEPYLRSGYRKYYRQTTRRFDEMKTEQLMWVEPELKIHCQFPALAPQQSLRIVATLADGRTLRGNLVHAPFFYRY
mgnify:CR=1 FL=1